MKAATQITLDDISNGIENVYVTHVEYTGEYFIYCSDGTTFELCDVEPYGLTAGGFAQAFKSNDAEWTAMRRENFTDNYHFHALA